MCGEPCRNRCRFCDDALAQRTGDGSSSVAS
jgi:hypothetical protein